MRSTNTANVACKPRPQAITRQLILRRLLDSPNPIASSAASPNTPRRRAPNERGAVATGAGAGVWTWGVTARAVVSCGGGAPRSVFHAKRGSVNTMSAHAHVTAHATNGRRHGNTRTHVRLAR